MPSSESHRVQEYHLVYMGYFDYLVYMEGAQKSPLGLRDLSFIKSLGAGGIYGGSPKNICLLGGGGGQR